MVITVLNNYDLGLAIYILKRVFIDHISSYSKTIVSYLVNNFIYSLNKISTMKHPSFVLNDEDNQSSNSSHATNVLSESESE